ncbi:MAG TPA: GxxExxY protein [Puia sp.]
MIENFPFKEETYDIIGLCIEVHKQLGHIKMQLNGKCKAVLYKREKEFNIVYKEIILPNKFYADFVLFENIILEVKAVEMELVMIS